MLGTSVGAGVSSPRTHAASPVGLGLGNPSGVGVGNGVGAGVGRCESSGTASKETGACSGGGCVSSLGSAAAGACSGAGSAAGRVSVLGSGAGCSETACPFSFSCLGAESSLVPWRAAALLVSPSALSSGRCRSGESSSRAGRGARRRESMIGTSHGPLWFQTWGQPPKPHRTTASPSPAGVVPGSTSPPIRACGAAGCGWLMAFARRRCARRVRGDVGALNRTKGSLGSVSRDCLRSVMTPSADAEHGSGTETPDGARLPRGTMRSQLFAIATVALSGVFTVLMFRSLKLVADAWFIGCVFHADGSKTCRWDVAWLPDPCLPPPPPPPPNTLGGSNGTLMHALFMSLAFGLLTPIGSISFTVRAAAWPSALLLAPGALPLDHHHPSGLRDSTRRLGASEGGEGGAGGEREREGRSPCRSGVPVQTHRLKSAPSTDQARRSDCHPSGQGRRTACS